MFNVLPESRRARRRATASAVISAAVHAVVIGAVGYASAAPPPRPVYQPRDTVLVFQPPRPDLRKPAGGVRPIPRRAETARETPLAPPTVPPDPLPRPLVFRDSLPLPPVDARLGEVFGRDSTRISVVGSHAGQAGPGREAGAPLPNAYGDRPAIALRENPSPRFPEMLRAAGVVGTVTLRFVIDSAGRVNERTVEVLHSDHEQFTAAVRAALPRMRFVPAEANGRRVRVLAEQRFEFRLDR